MSQQSTDTLHMPNIRRLPSGSWCAQVRLTGFPAQSKTFPTEAEASQWGIDKEAALLAQRAQAVLEPVQAENAKKTVLNLFESYFNSSYFKAKRSTSKEVERRRANQICKLIGSYFLDHVTVPVVQLEYIDKRLDQKSRRTGDLISPTTVRAERTLLSTVFRYGVRMGILKNNPLQDGRALFSPPNRKRINFLTEEELCKLIECARIYSNQPNHNTAFYPWLLFTTFTGTRPGEAARIKIEHYHHTYFLLPAENHKNNKPRTILIPKSIQSILLEQYRDAVTSKSIYFFPSSKTSAQSLAYSYPFKKCLEITQITKNVVPHSLRHSFVTAALMRQIPPDMVANFVGHSNVSSLEPYKHLTTHALAPEFEKFALSFESSIESHDAALNSKNAAFNAIQADLLKRLGVTK